MLKEVTIGWRWLETTLNSIIREVNTNKPLNSATIAVEAHSTGSILRVVKSLDDNQPGTQTSGGGGADPSGGQWISVNVVDANCNKSTIQVWGKP